MEELQLYLLEVLVKKIEFTPPYVKFPSKDRLQIYATFRNLVSMHIKADDSASSEVNKIELRRRQVNVDFRKSQEFYCKPEKLVLAFHEGTLDVYFSASYKPTPLGKAMISLPLSFLNLAEKSRWVTASITEVEPACVNGIYEILSYDGAQIGKVEMCVTLVYPKIGTVL